MPALDSGTESIWDRIEAIDGQVPSPEVVEASRELLEERSAEVRFLDEEGAENLLDALDWYRDPISHLHADPLYLDRIEVAEFDLPIRVNDDVKKWMRYFLGSGRKYYRRYLARSTRYRPMIEASLKARGMPLDLFYLSMIESGFSPHAYSSAGAAGLWQFMSATALAYDLRVDWWIDERRDPERATDAATRHLQDLHRTFGDWYLAAAAYNAGAGRIRRAMTKTGPGDFWFVAKPGILPEETRNYVPKLIAAAIIGHHPTRYGFTDIQYETPLGYDKVQVPASTTVASMAKCASLSQDDFGALNPALRRWALPPDPASYTIKVPKGAGEDFRACVSRLPPTERIAFTRHKVRKGESLGSIAKRYGVSADALAAANDLTNRHRLVVGMELVIPGASGASTPVRVSSSVPTTSASASGEGTRKVKETRTTWHTVRPGENLAGIAARYGVSVADLKAWNGIRNANHIEAGQRLKIHRSTWVTASVPATASKEARVSTPTSSPSTVAATAAPPPQPPAKDKAPASTSTRYQVQKGDTVSSIATRFKVSQKDLCAWNDITDPTSLKAGQTLVIRQASTGWTTYKVQRGDTLSSIAKKHGVSVDEIKAWNNLSSSTIQVGQSLKIKKK
jgi:membrane-bound lytic murein transglycosylase D